METKTRKEKILHRSRIEGLRAPVDSVPDFSEGNLQFWKTRLDREAGEFLVRYRPGWSRFRLAP